MPATLLLHIILAIFSLIFTGILIFKPTKQKINYTFLLFLGTLVTGTYMIFTMNVNILVTCLEGLAFMGVVLGGIAIARRKLAKEELTQKHID